VSAPETHRTRFRLERCNASREGRSAEPAQVPEAEIRPAGTPAVAKIEIGRRVINFFLMTIPTARRSEILAQGESYGPLHVGPGQGRWLVEFVSANPTGPLHVGMARRRVRRHRRRICFEAVGYRVGARSTT